MPAEISDLTEAAPPDGPSDDDLARSTARGDRAAFSELYDRHARHVYTVARRVLACESDAEAVVSDVFTEFWRKPERFDASRGSCRTYLVVMSRSRAIDRLRSERTRDERIAEATSTAGPTGWAAPPPDRRAEEDEQLRLVRSAVESLEEKQREPLRLAYFEGLTHRQIAERLDQPLGTVKTRVRAALQSLKSKLRPTGRRDDAM